MDTPTPATPRQAPANETVMGILAYLGILFLVPLIVSKNDPFVKFHVKQGLVLFCLELIVSFVGYGFGYGFGLLVFLPIVELLNLAILVFVIIGIINVANHQQKELPIVGHFASMFTF
jgi:uncharacterized membrane protein